jgi:hypothetical protein
VIPQLTREIARLETSSDALNNPNVARISVRRVKRPREVVDVVLCNSGAAAQQAMGDLVSLASVCTLREFLRRALTKLTRP